MGRPRRKGQSDRPKRKTKDDRPKRKKKKSIESRLWWALREEPLGHGETQPKVSHFFRVKHKGVLGIGVVWFVSSNKSPAAVLKNANWYKLVSEDVDWIQRTYKLSAEISEWKKTELVLPVEAYHYLER